LLWLRSILSWANLERHGSGNKIVNISSAVTPDSELCHNHCSVTNTIPRTEAMNALKLTQQCTSKAEITH